MALGFVSDMNSSLDWKQCRPSSDRFRSNTIFLLFKQSFIVMYMIFILLKNSPMIKNIFQFSGCNHY